tara:strand:- start:6505 stop:6726 length:222 start_codon:yes stop_codon:yes gene_type:complete
VANVLEQLDLDKGKSTANKRGIYSIDKWCRMNGYPGVTRDCIDSAKQSDDPKIVKMAKDAMITKIADSNKRSK